MAHYYFTKVGPYYSADQARPDWLVEGGADFMASYIDARLGFKSLEERQRELDASTRESCHARGFENILKLTIPTEHSHWRTCKYLLGEQMLLSLFFAMGESGLSAAIREVYLTGHFYRPFPQRHSLGYPSDLQLYQIFLKHTPPGTEDAVRDVYRRIHGGPYIPADN